MDNAAKIRVVELFAGVGGFRVGLERCSSQFETVWASQWEPGQAGQWAYKCYCQRFGEKANCSNEDIATVINDVPEHDLLVGGFPCQDYSVAHTGAQGIEGKKGVLWWSIDKIIKLRHRIDTTFIYVTHDQTEAMTLGDRIVIMKDGYIQQIGTPQEVFNHPANLFVAGFIGMPVMNFFDAQLIREGSKYFVEVGGYRTELSAQKEERLLKNDVQSQEITLGVRPEHTDVSDSGVSATVEVAEMMGSSVHLHVNADGHDVIIIVPTTEMTGNYEMGDTVHFSFKGSVAHVFSKETDRNLEF